MTNILIFNTKKHTLQVESESRHLRGVYSEIMTIQLSQAHYNFYEVYQESQDSRRVPLFRFPIQNTIIKYEHS